MMRLYWKYHLVAVAASSQEVFQARLNGAWSNVWKVSLPMNELNGIERLAEDAIVTGSYKNKTLCANPEDTCDFNRAAHLASTPFHGVVAQRVPAPAFSQSELKEEDSPESRSAPQTQETPVCEGAYTEALSVKKLREKVTDGTEHHINAALYFWEPLWGCQTNYYLGISKK
ncbi:mitotic checkpoint serine/threonine-protein kinase BUB1 beta-like [Poecile atricapillus]|uniref:mitotic checkpoint serine/threonine-protein kinase BUB1 beta-like n=1 Tax=Poecile atricapillus TaxID=48891 RepID=UPI00273A2245|nr:mitotic checkpoint serine/threonine-protein kinase BUB1 beta-like [Poecile atricapillus]